ncbi:MAG: amino acid permease [Sphingomonas sp.]|uniref:APC family permease n=1 Tax=Sphingomonas sp. TaxID=28214 RepID=UPI001AD2D1C5|nr:amino acid permease [Sphingomonas sp.]MBN8808475.1 amino acid permease [Sphingomonas sp.]
MDTIDEQVIRRPFGFWMATALVVGGMIGSGIFLMPVGLAPLGWTAVAAWGISIGGAVALAFTMARLAQAMPQASGAVAVTGAALGELAGVMVGWSYWVGVWSANAGISIAAASYLGSFVPWVRATPLNGALTAVALIWLLTLLNLGGAKAAGRFQVVTTALKLIPLVTVIVLAGGGLATGRASLASGGIAIGSIASAVTLTLYPLVGFEAAGVAAERVRDPARNVMRASMAGTAGTGLLYILVSIAFLTLPATTLAASGAPFELLVSTFWSAGPALAIAAFAGIAAIGALNGWVLIQGEVPLGMARAGLLPGWFGRVSARDVPVRVLVVSSTLASLLVLSNASASLGQVFVFVATLATCSTLWLYAAIAVAALKHRIAVPAALVGLAFAVVAFVGAGEKAFALSFALMATALPLYLLRPKRGLAEQPAE